MTAPTLRPLSVGEILDVSFTLYRRHFIPMATVALVCSGVPVLLLLFIAAAGGMWQQWMLTIAYYVAILLSSAIATAATVFIVSSSYLGQPLGARDALSRSMPLLLRLIACSILLAILIGAAIVGVALSTAIIGPAGALLVLLLPILLCGLLVAFPALVLERGITAATALVRSWSLTSGARWRMFGLVITLTILLIIPVVAVLGLIGIAVAASGPSAATVATVTGILFLGLIQVFFYPIVYCVLTVAYYDLRVRKEGFDLEVLASTLQPA